MPYFAAVSPITQERYDSPTGYLATALSIICVHELSQHAHIDSSALLPLVVEVANNSMRNLDDIATKNNVDNDTGFAFFNLLALASILELCMLYERAMVRRGV